MDPAIAKLLNERFVCVKVDREERPDVDQVYMTALQAFGNGGWPMSMFLTPDGRPFFGGTYFPPEDRDGIPGFPTILQGVAEAWRDQRPEVEKTADRLAEVVRRSIAGATAERPGARLACGGRRGPRPAGRAVRPRVRRVRLLGPRTRAGPSSPSPSTSSSCSTSTAATRPGRRGRQEAGPTRPGPLAMVLKTLDHMARGGIRDQLGRRLPPLLDQPVLDRPALREDALRQRPARLGPPARLRGHRRPPLAGRGRGHLRLRRAVDDLPRGGLLLGPRRRDRGRGGGLLRLDPRAGPAGPRRGDGRRGVRPGLRPEARAQLREGPLRPARAPLACRPGPDAQDHARGPRGPPRPAPRQAPGRPRRPPRPLARRQGADLVERPDDRGLRRRLPPAEGRRLSPGRREGRRLPPDQAPDPRRPPAADLPRRAGQAAGLPGGLRLPGPRPAPAPRRHRRPEAAGAGPRADRPDDRRLRRHRAGGLLLHRRRPREPARPPQGPVRQRPAQRQQRRHPQPRRARRRDGRAELPRPRGQGPRRLQPGHGAEPRRAPPDARRPRRIPRRPPRRRRGPAHEAPEADRSRPS